VGGARNAVKLAASLVDRVRPPPPGLVVLIYHRVGGRTAIEVDLPTGMFDEQLAYLTEHVTVVPLSEGLARLADPASPREPLVAVTFDDGTADFADEALPVIVRHAVPVTLYVATEFVEHGLPFPDDGRPVSWKALGDAASTGLVDVGSHTHTHALLDRLDPALVGDELDRSIALVGERIGTRPRHFAYPKAVAGSPAADLAVRARFASAALAGTRVNRYGATDPHRLARSPVQVSDGDRWFRSKVIGGMALEDTVRRVVNRARYASATS
jgi:peptidoglycan/xylan/chitin deacetylase (PgdA/CDA1 family)